MITRAQARDALAAGAVVVLPRRQVALPSLEADRTAAAAVGGTISHLSAALDHGWKVKAPPAKPTITVPRRRRLPDDLPEMELHWADLPDAAVAEGVTTPAQTVIDCSRAYDFDVALCVADSALRSEVVTRDELVVAAKDSPRTGRAHAFRVARQASGLAANPFESVLRAIALDVPGLQVRPQGWIGNAGRADLVDDRLMIAIEADSWEHHGTRETFKHDVRRYAEFARRGWVVVRFLWEDVMRQPHRVHRHLAQVAAVRARQLRRSAGSSRF
jgi:very-short-patch-repair endonuclease